MVTDRDRSCLGGGTAPSIGPVRILACICALAAATLLFTAAQAGADGRIGIPLSQGPGGVSFGVGLAVSEERGGDIYVADTNTNQRIDEFEPDGAFVRAFGWGIVPGAATGTGTLTAGSTFVTNVTTTSGAFATPSGGGKMISSPGKIAPGTVIAAVTPTLLELSQPAIGSGTAVPLTVAAGPGNVSTNEVQKLTIAAAGGEFKLTFESPQPARTIETTAAIDHEAGAAQVQSALEALPNIGAGNVDVSGGPGDETGGHPYLIEFKGRYADTNVRRLAAVAGDLSGGSPSSAATLTTTVEGGGVLETCTTACTVADAEEGGGYSAGAAPGQFANPEAVAVDNSCAEQEPPLSGAACESFDPSYGDVYVADAKNHRVQKFGPEGEFILMIGGEVDKTTHADVCTAADLTAGDTCGAGVPGSGPSHFYKEEPPTQAGGFKDWGNPGRSNSIAIGPDGTVYVGDYGRVQEFDPDGSFTGELALSEANPKFVSALAVDGNGNIFERSAIYFQSAELQSQVPGVREYTPAHSLIRTFDAGPGSEPTHIAVDREGDLFLSDASGGEEGLFRAFRPDGTLYAVFSSDQVTASFDQFGHKLSGPNAWGIAVGDASGNLYATSLTPEGPHVAVHPLPVSGPPLVAAETVGDIQPFTATLHGVVNPKGFKTTYHFEYGPTLSYGQSTAPAELDLVDQGDPVQAPITSLSLETAYHYRLVAESHCNKAEPLEVCVTEGPDATFETLPAVSVRDFTTQIVGPELVELKAELNPNNGFVAGGGGAEYTIRYGRDKNYKGGAAHGTVKAGGQFEAITATFAGLQPHTEYHYELSALNSNGESITEDRTFTTERSAAEERAAEIAECPNAGLREQDNAQALPDCRDFELVSPIDKSGGQAFPKLSLASGGERILYRATGGFGNPSLDVAFVPYIAQRTVDGWSSRPTVGQGDVIPGVEPGDPVDYAANLGRWLIPQSPGMSYEQSHSSDTGFLSMAFVDGPLNPHATPPITVSPAENGDDRVPNVYYLNAQAGHSDDFSRFFTKTGFRELPGNRPSAKVVLEFTHIYEVSGADGESSTRRLVAQVPLGLDGSTCVIDSSSEAHIGEGTTALTQRATRLASSDGATVFYSSPIENEPGPLCGEGSNNPIGLFARTGEAPAVQLNKGPASQCSLPACLTATPKTPTFYGTSPDAHRAWFTTSQPLIDADTDSTKDLYLAKLDHGQLTELVLASAGEASPQHPSPGQGASVKGVVRISADGSRASFVAAGVLTTEANASTGQSAAPGADNLYVYDAATGQIKFVARTCTGPGKSGSIVDPACPTTGGAAANDALWGASPPSAEMTPDGRYLLFTSHGRLTSDDSDNAGDVYRYDFQTGQLLRLSIGRNGNDGNGNDSSFPAQLEGVDSLDVPSSGREVGEDSFRAISADGSTALFHTAAPLVSRDTDGAANPGCESGETGCDVYEWEEAGHGTCHEAGGCVSPISSGLDPHGSAFAVIGSSGADIAFQTQRGLVPGDTDGVGDVYDARANGGFAYTPPQSPCGSNETCHGPIPSEPPPPSLTTEHNESGGNGPTKLECGKGRHRVKKHGEFRCVPNKHHKKRSHRKHKRTAGHNRGGAK